MNNYIFIFLLLFILCLNNKESYENIYQKNDILKDEPDNKQFYACGQKNMDNDDSYLYDKYPNSNYYIKPNSVKEPQVGTYSAFVDVNKIRTYDHFYHAPICEDTYPFVNNIDSQFRLIPGAFPEEDISLLYQEEKDKDTDGLKNPYYLYGHPKNIQNKILYKNNINDMFLRHK